MLHERYGVEFLRGVILPADCWRPFPPASDRQAWESLLRHPLMARRRDYLVGLAEGYLGQPWPPLPASLYLEFSRTGNRIHYETPYFARRQRLGALVLAECMEAKGRFLDDIVDGIWLICEEATWCIPAHSARAPASSEIDCLPRQDIPSVDLFACETAMTLAEIGYLLSGPLEAISPVLLDRVRRQIAERVVEPAETRDDYWWFSGRNNWTPWCCSNVLGAAFYTLNDVPRLAALSHRLMAAADKFLARYKPDGGCDEGPMYWGVAAGALLLFLELLHSRTAGEVTFYDEPLIAAMGRYIVHAHLDGPWFTNFADASPRGVFRTALTYRYGQRIACGEMQDLALLAERNWRADGPVDPPLARHFVGGDICHMLRELFWIPPEEQPRQGPLPLDAFLPDLQVMVARQSPVAGQGLVLAIKGGHNDESHNHNDIGQFILMCDGQPVIVDLGRETYTRQTFSPQRYELWFTRSASHNVPLVNGSEQRPGAEFAACEVHHASSPDASVMDLRLDRAYGPEASLISLTRRATLQRSPSPVGESSPAVIIEDECEVRSGPVEVVVTLYSPRPCTSPCPGQVVFELDARQPSPSSAAAAPAPPRRVTLAFDPAVVTAQLDVVDLTDPDMRKGWGPRLTRVRLTGRTPGKRARYKLEFRL